MDIQNNTMQEEIYDPLLDVWGVPDKYGVMYSADGKRIVGCRNCLLEEYTVREGCELIANQAFCGCIKLRKITMPESLIGIGIGAFKLCINLQGIDIPSSVRYIGPHAFEACKCLRHVELPQSLKKLGYGCFADSGVSEVTSLSPCFECRDGFVIDIRKQRLVAFIPYEIHCTVPEDVCQIGHEAFATTGEHQLRGVLITVNVECIIGNPFFGSTVRYCESLAKRYEMHQNCLMDMEKRRLIAFFGLRQQVRIPGITKVIGDGAFYRNSTLEKVTMSSSVISVGNRAFQGCIQLKEVEPSPNITRIGSGAFSYCEQLRTFQIPNKVTEIKDYTFDLCKALEEILLPSGIKKIGRWAFSSCFQLKEIIIPPKTAIIEQCAFAYCMGLETVRIPPSVSHIAQKAFLYCNKFQRTDLSTCKDGERKEAVLIPDLHGRMFWKEAIAASNDDTQIIFLGDYTDPYGFEEITAPEAFRNFVEVVNYARRHQKVELLLGNHDCGYIFGSDVCNCRTDKEHYQEIRQLFQDNIDLFKFCTEVRVGEKRYIVSHAGINLYWLEKFSKEFFENGKIEYDTLCERINERLLHSPLDSNQMSLLSDVSRHRGGISPYGSIVWTDIDEFGDGDVHIPIDQIVGHTLQAFEEFDENNYSMYYGGANVKKGLDSTVYCIDTAEAYYLDGNGIIRYMRNDKPVEMLKTCIEQKTGI